MSKKLFLSLFCFCTSLLGYGNVDSLLNVLDQNIEQRSDLLEQKYQRINTLRQQLSQSKVREDSFQIILNLTREYQSFNYDTAFVEIQRLKRSAATEEEKTIVELQESFILLSAGLFRESTDKLNGLFIEDKSDAIKSQYYFYLARSYFDMSDVYTGYLKNDLQYKMGLAFLEKAILYTSENSVEQLSYKGLAALKRYEVDNARSIYKQLIHHPDITTRQLAIEYSALSSLYRDVSQDTVLMFMIKAAIADEQSLVKESTALTFLANYYAGADNFERASRYINLALADANFFGAQHRKMEILNILPLIERRQLEIEKSKFRQFVFFSSILTILLLLSVFLVIRTVRQNRKINAQNQHIQQQNEKLKESEANILTAYKKLEVYSQKLNESTRLKEKYIGHFFQSNTNLINKVNALFTKSIKQLHEGKFKEAIAILKQFNEGDETKKLLQDFDSTFLTVFPTFIEQMNQFFPEGEKFDIPRDNILTTEQRIFALVRLGISNHNTIANVHNFSVNTIYAYKSKIRSKSALSSDEFDKAVMGIRSIWDREEG